MSQASDKSLMVVVGDISADRHTARVLTKLKQMMPNLSLFGAGGPKMREAGVELIADCQEWGVVGILAAAKFVPFYNRLKAQLVSLIEPRNVGAVMLVDFSGLNLSLAKMVKKAYPNVPIIYFISPQVWASRPWRINTIAKTVSKMLVLFPFEETLYRDKGVNARFVGHPLTRDVPSGDNLMSKEEFCRLHGLDAQKPLIGVFSGSRKSEIKNFLPVIAQSIDWLAKDRPDCQFVVSMATPALAEFIKGFVARNSINKLLPHRLVLTDASENYNLMSAADLIWAKSGTTTLEVTLFGKPMLIFYRGDWLSYPLFLIGKRVKWVGWPNLLAHELLVPELFQLDCRAELFVRYTRDLLEVPALRAEICEKLLSLRDQLGQGDYVETCAQELAQLLNQQDVQDVQVSLAK